MRSSPAQSATSATGVIGPRPHHLDDHGARQQQVGRSVDERLTTGGQWSIHPVAPLADDAAFDGGQKWPGRVCPGRCLQKGVVGMAGGQQRLDLCPQRVVAPARARKEGLTWRGVQPMEGIELSAPQDDPGKAGGEEPFAGGEEPCPGGEDPYLGGEEPVAESEAPCGGDVDCCAAGELLAAPDIGTVSGDKQACIGRDGGYNKTRLTGDLGEKACAGKQRAGDADLGCGSPDQDGLRALVEGDTMDKGGTA